MQQWSIPAWAVVGALVLVAGALVLVAVALLRTRSRLAEAEGLRRRLDQLERRLAEPEPEPRAADQEYVITHVGEPEPQEPAPTVPAPLFADLVLRETVVQAASLAAGLRRALLPETRNRIRFEMRREVRRARRQRRADLRQARREWEARQRAEVDLGDVTDGDAA